MWPREFLRDDLPNARVLTFGYNTKLSSNMSHTFGDYVSQFLSTLQLARKKVQLLSIEVYDLTNFCSQSIVP